MLASAQNDAKVSKAPFFASAYFKNSTIRCRLAVRILSYASSCSCWLAIMYLADDPERAGSYGLANHTGEGASPAPLTLPIQSPALQRADDSPPPHLQAPSCCRSLSGARRSP